MGAVITEEVPTAAELKTAVENVAETLAKTPGVTGNIPQPVIVDDPLQQEVVEEENINNLCDCDGGHKYTEDEENYLHLLETAPPATREELIQTVDFSGHSFKISVSGFPRTGKSQILSTITNIMRSRGLIAVPGTKQKKSMKVLIPGEDGPKATKVQIESMEFLKLW